jgi:uncharacterized membrane protein
MTNTRLPASIFVFLTLLAALQGYYYASQLPDVLASHFGSGGRPNGWQSQTGFFSLELVVVVMAAFFAFGVPRIIARVPLSLVNVPNKEWWFGPQRRDSTQAFFRVQFGWFGCALLGFLLFVNELVFRANLASPRRLNGTAFTIAMLTFLAFVAIWTLRLIGHFAKREN